MGLPMNNPSKPAPAIDGGQTVPQRKNQDCPADVDRLLVAPSTARSWSENPCFGGKGDPAQEDWPKALVTPALRGSVLATVTL